MATAPANIAAPTSSTTPDRQTTSRAKPAAKPKPKSRPRDPQKPVSTGEGSLDFDEPGSEEVAPRSAAKSQPREAKRPAKPGKLARAPEADAKPKGPQIDGDDDDGLDAYERVAAKFDRLEDKKKPADKRRQPEARDDRRSERREPARRQVEEPEENDEEENLVVGDELELPETDELDDDQNEDEDEFSRTILREAAEYGFSEEEAREFGSVANLQKTLAAMDRRFKELGKTPENPDDKTSPGGDTSTVTKPTQDSGRAANESPKKPSLGQSATENADDSPKALTYEDLDPEGVFDEGTRGLVTKIVDHYNGRVADALEKLTQTQSRFESFVQHVEDRNHRAFLDEMDNFFTGLGKEYEDVFGTGTYEDLDDETDKVAIKNRKEFVSEMNQVAKGMRAAGLPVPSPRKIKQRVLRSFGPAVEKREQEIRRETLNKVKRRDGNRISEPTHREPSRKRDMSPEDRAGDLADNFYRDRGYNIPRYAGDDDDEI